MRSRPLHTLILLVAAALGAALLGPAPTASAATSAVTAASISPGTVSVTGLLGTAFVDVSVTVVADPQVDYCGEESPMGGGAVNAELSRISGGPPDTVHVVLALAQGDLKTGTWTGRWRVASTRGGTWAITSVWWCHHSTVSGVDGSVRIDPRVSPGYTGTVVVHGYAPPVVTVTRIPRIAPYRGRQYARLVYRNAHCTPLAGRLVTWGPDVYCGGYGDGIALRRLDSQGGITLRIDATTSMYWQCVYLANPPMARLTADSTILRMDVLTAYTYFRSVTARPAAPTFRVGTTLRVTSYVSPRVGVASLQVLRGRTWRTLASTFPGEHGLVVLRVPATARASLVTGRHLYRVLAHGGGMAPTPSRTFVLVGR